jgi:myo-inositol-1(or 4)-monophosphatase
MADDLLAVLNATATAVRAALDTVDDWTPAGQRPGQYAIDVVADAAALAVLEAAGVGVLSEESGLTHEERAVLVVVDPVDGSTNASRGLPWYATSLCALDDDGPLAAVVVNQASGARYEAVRGGGATCDGRPIRPSGCRQLSDAMVGLCAWSVPHLGWRAFRMLGAAALDLCAVADGRLDGYLDASTDSLSPWDYLGGLLVCREAGAVVVDAFDRDLVCRGWDDRRTPLAAATPALLAEVVATRRKYG